MPAFSARAHFADMQTNLGLMGSAEKSADAEAATHNLPEPSHPWHPDPTSWIPAGLYNGMVAPFTPYAIRGFLWCQGKTDRAPGPAGHYRNLRAMLNADHSQQWRQGRHAFLFVQIPRLHSG